MACISVRFTENLSRTPLRGAWIEILWLALKQTKGIRRTPLRGAWIEIGIACLCNGCGYIVAPRSGVRGLKYQRTPAQ